MGEERWTEYIWRGPNGHLWVEDKDCVELADEFGTPLFVYSENQVRKNYRDFRDAFRERYEDVVVAAGIKANNLLAIRRLLAQEGAGADCFVGELEIAMLAGTDPGRVFLNGSNKLLAELRAGIALGVTINVDNLQELETIQQLLAKTPDSRANICIRVKLPLKQLEDQYISDYRYHPPRMSLADWARGHKFGMDLEAAMTALCRAFEIPRLAVRGIHYHLKSQTTTASHYSVFINELVQFMLRVREELEWQPEILNLGGGFGYGRAEGYGGGGEARVASSFRDYADAILVPLTASLERHKFGWPTIVLEPGRVMVANAAVLITRVGTVKEIPPIKKRWVHVDASTNSLMRIRTSNWYYHMIPVAESGEGDEESYEGQVDIAGPLCDAADILARDIQVGKVLPGDLLAVLDVGAYTESTLCHFNSQPRPASVLVNGSSADLIVRRETVQDILACHEVPARLWASATEGQC